MASDKRLIDANAIQYTLEREPGGWGGEPQYIVTQNEIDRMPTVDAVEVVHGRWEQGDYYDFGDVCSNCDWDSERDNCQWSYCPNCGAKMDGGADHGI